VLALRSAEWLVAPRVRLVDDQRRIVRVINARKESRRDPPPDLSHHWTDAMHRRYTDLVGNFYGRPSRRDLDYVLLRTAGGDDLFALVMDQAEPSVIVRRSTNGSDGTPRIGPGAVRAD
jgi:hypothetical protein